MIPKSALLVALASIGACLPGPLEKRASLPPKYSVQSLGVQKSNLPNEYRDGGGGAKINGVNVIWYADGEYTSDGKPPNSGGTNVAGFVSNSIAYSGYKGAAITSMTDFGSTSTGPNQAIPFFTNNGENGQVTGIWPNEPISTLCNGLCGVGFVQVINRTAYSKGTQAALYNTPVQINVTANGPVVGRPVQKLFVYGEPGYGTFSSFLGIDGYLYAFAAIGGTNTGDGIKMARVPQGSWSSRSSYTYWNGHAWSATMPAYNDGGASNIFNWTEQSLDGKYYGPGTGNLFYSPVYNTYLLLFQSGAGIDNSVYLTYSQTNNLPSPFSAPVKVTTLNSTTGGLTYSFNAYPNYDSTGKVIPISWASAGTSSNSALSISMANITFS